MSLPSSEAGREWAAFALLALVAVAAWALVPTYPNYDAYYHLVWGRELLDGVRPGFEVYAAPTQHPLYLALGALLSLIGEDADRALVLVTVLSLVALTWGTYALGRALFGVWPGVLAAAAVCSSFAFLLYAVRGYLDVPFLALVVWAGAVEARGAGGDRHRVAPMALLAVAGLLRPEAWVLAGLLWLWRWPRSSVRRRVELAVLVGVAPVLWAIVDVAVTGDPLFSLNSTSDLAEALGRERGISNVPSAFVEYLTDVARPPVAAAGAVGVALAVWRFGWRAMIVPLALLGAGMLTFVGTGIAGLSILPRYLTVPAVGLCVVAGYAVLGWTSAPPGVWRERWRRGSYVALALGVVFVAARYESFDRLRDELRFNERTHEQLAALLGTPLLTARLCTTDDCAGEEDDLVGPIMTFPTYRVIPDALWITDEPRGAYVARRRPVSSRCSYGVYVRGTRKEVTRFGEADGVSRATNRLPARRRLVAREGPFRLYATSCPGS